VNERCMALLSHHYHHQAFGMFTSLLVDWSLGGPRDVCGSAAHLITGATMGALYHRATTLLTTARTRTPHRRFRPVHTPFCHLPRPPSAPPALAHLYAQPRPLSTAYLPALSRLWACAALAALRSSVAGHIEHHMFRIARGRLPALRCADANTGAHFAAALRCRRACAVPGAQRACAPRQADPRSTTHTTFRGCIIIAAARGKAILPQYLTRCAHASNSAAA